MEVSSHPEQKRNGIEPTKIFLGVMSFGFTVRVLFLFEFAFLAAGNALLPAAVIYILLYLSLKDKLSARSLRRTLVLIMMVLMVFDHHSGFTDNFTLLISLDLVRYGSVWANMGSDNGLFPLCATTIANILLVIYAMSNPSIEDVFVFFWPAVVFPSGLIYVWTVYHIKLLKIEKEAREASKVKSLFIAKMSHEFRTPLNAISLSLSNLQSTEVSPDQVRFIHDNYFLFLL